VEDAQRLAGGGQPDAPADRRELDSLEKGAGVRGVIDFQASRQCRRRRPRMDGVICGSGIHRLRARLDLIPDQRGADMADLPGGGGGLLVRALQGQGSRPAGDAYRLRRGLAGRRIARPRALGRRGIAAGRRAEERKPPDASPGAITLALLLTGEELDSLEKRAGDGEIAGRGRPGGSDVASP
jgi:hypothetical protein